MKRKNENQAGCVVMDLVSSFLTDYGSVCSCCLSRQECDFELYRHFSFVIKTMHPRAFSPAMFLAFFSCQLSCDILLCLTGV